MAEFDPKSVSPLDWTVIGAGLVGFISTFFPWYTISFDSPGFASYSAHANGWHSFLSWFSMLLLVAGGALVLARAMGTQVNLPVPTAVATMAIGALAFLLVLLRWVTLDNGIGAGFGLFLGLICAAAMAVASFMAFRAAGGNFNQLRQTPGTTPPIG
jgi:hypothetical protein